MELTKEGFIKCEGEIYIYKVSRRKCLLREKSLERALALKSKRIIKVRCKKSEPGMIAMKRDGKWLCRECLRDWEMKNTPWVYGKIF